MELEDILKENLHYTHSRVGVTNCYEVGIFGQSVYHYKNGFLPSRIRQTIYVIRRYIFPYFFWDREWLQQSPWREIFTLMALASITILDEIFNKTPHASPIEVSLNSLVGFVIPLMEVAMYFYQNGSEKS